LKDRQNALHDFREHYIAHRGLFNNTTNAPENTIQAFKKAVEAGYGIELDAQLSSDNQVVVTHDYDLKRISGVDKAINDLTYQELSEYAIFDSVETIPLLSDVLNVIAGKVPLIVEIKVKEDYKTICKLTSEILVNYSGKYCVESFSPHVVNWYKKNQPKVIRGQLADNVQNWFLRNMLYNAINKPDFIAYNHQFGKKKCLSFWKKVLGCSLVAWTIKSQTELDEAAKIFDIFIFDSFIPK
jgi:glycerophosphoryl diester phosphodiesterase